MSVILIIVASPEKLQDLFLTRFRTTMKKIIRMQYVLPSCRYYHKARANPDALILSPKSS